MNLSADRSTSKEAAAASAAHEVLIAVYPDQKASLDEMLSKSMAAIAEGEPKAKGIGLGKKAAAEMIALRANDGFDAPERYRPHTSPGAYVPTVVHLFSTIGAATPWAMTNGSQFRPAPPLALKKWRDPTDIGERPGIGTGPGGASAAIGRGVARSVMGSSFAVQRSPSRDMVNMIRLIK